MGFAVSIAALLGSGCDAAGGSGSGGRVSVTARSSPGCLALGLSPFPPGLALLPDDPDAAVALSFETPKVVFLELGGDAPVESDIPTLSIPDDSDGDGENEGSAAVPDAPKLDGVFVADPELAAAGLGLVTASGYEEVIVFDTALGTLASVEIEVDASFDPADFRRLPLPGTSGLRTAISSDVCIKPAAPIGSDDVDYAEGIPPEFFCDPEVAGSFYAKFTSGAAVAAGRLFVSVSNLGDGGGTENARYLPGAVLVFDLDLDAVPPRVSPNPMSPFLETSAYNPTHVTRIEAADREFVVVTLSGALGIVQDDPNTSAIEAGALPLSRSALEVIDPETLEIVAETDLADPLLDTAAFDFDRLAVDPTGRVAVVGSAGRRSVYVVDLAPLATLASPGDRLEEPLRAIELSVPKLPGGPPDATCSGSTGGVAFNDAGDVLYVLERCDGTLTRFGVGLPVDAGDDVETTDFTLLTSEPLVASLVPENFGEDRDPGTLRVRPGRPGIDFSGPDLVFLIAQPLGQVCAHSVESL
jgi:hypothetical protein